MPILIHLFFYNYFFSPSEETLHVPNDNTVKSGGYSAKGVEGATPLGDIQNYFGANAQIPYAVGCTLTGKDKSGLA